MGSKFKPKFSEYEDLHNQLNVWQGRAESAEKMITSLRAQLKEANKLATKRGDMLKEAQEDLVEADSLFNERELAWEAVHKYLQVEDVQGTDLPTAISKIGNRAEAAEKGLGIAQNQFAEKVRELEAAEAENQRLREEFGKAVKYIEEGGHSCEFTRNPEAGKCDFCEMMADFKQALEDK